MAWWFDVTPHTYCCPFVCAKGEERPRSWAGASGQSGASLASAELVNHAPCSHRSPGTQARELFSWGKEPQLCSNRWDQPIGSGLTLLALVCFSLVDTYKIYIYIFKPVFQWWWSCCDLLATMMRVASGDNVCHLKYLWPQTCL